MVARYDAMTLDLPWLEETKHFWKLTRLEFKEAGHSDFHHNCAGINRSFRCMNQLEKARSEATLKERKIRLHNMKKPNMALDYP